MSHYGRARGRLSRGLVPDGGKRQVRLGELAAIHANSGPAMIRDEDGMVTGYVYVDIAGRDPQGYVSDGQQLLRSRLKLPAGYSLSWSGQYEALAPVNHRLPFTIP